MPRIDAKKFRQSLTSAEMRKAVSNCLIAQAMSEATQEHVDRYVKDIFDRMSPTFPLSSTAKLCKVTKIESPDQIYQAELDSPQVREFFAACTAAHKANGYQVPDGVCPKLLAKSLHLAAIRVIVELAAEMVGTPAVEDLCVLENGLERMADLFICGVLAEEKLK